MSTFYDITAILPQRLSKDDIDNINSNITSLFNFDKYKDKNDTISIKELKDIIDEKFDVFLSHDWGAGELNHKKVCAINNELKKLGINAWIDEERMNGNVQEKMTFGIDNSLIVIVFITRNYMEKVDGTNAGDNCKLEFRYSCLKKKSTAMLAVVMDPNIRNTSDWSPTIAMNLGGELYVDMADDYMSPKKIKELYQRIITMIKQPIKVVFDTFIQDLLNAQVPTLNTLSISDNIDNASKSLIDEMTFWLTNSAYIVPKEAIKIATIIFDNGIGNIDRLTKKIQKNNHLLKEFGIDEDDEEDILNALKKLNTATNTTITTTNIDIQTKIIQEVKKLGVQAQPQASGFGRVSFGAQPQTFAFGVQPQASAFTNSSETSKIIPKRPLVTSTKPLDDVRKGDWTCNRCNCNNFSNKLACFTCHKVRPGFEEGFPHVIDNNSNKEQYTFESIHMKPQIKIMPGDWQCLKCKEIVFAKRNRCYKCSSPKP